MSRNSSPLRLVVCSTGIPHAHWYKGLSASLITLYHYVAEMKSAGVRLCHVLILDKKNDDPDLLAAYKAAMEEKDVLDLLVWRTPSFIEPRGHSYHPIVPRRLPDEFVADVRQFKPDALFMLDAYATASLQHERIAPVVVQVHDPKFQTLWHHSLFALRERPSRFPHVAADLVQCWRWRQYYQRALRDVDSVLTVASSAERLLRRAGISAKHFPMGWPEIAPYDEHRPPSSGTPTFLFQGNLAGLGSRSALHFLFEKAYPHMRRQWGKGGFVINLCGSRSLPSWAERMIGNLPEVRFLGFVDDLAALMRSSHAVLAPIDVPVGNRTRILTAMSLGVLTIAHRVIADGNPHLVDDVTCYLADDPAAFVERMVRAYTRPEDARRITREARAVYERQFHPRPATEALLAEIERVAQPS